jgi:hypothetical protein
MALGRLSAETGITKIIVKQVDLKGAPAWRR